jgi:hypothetical protein
MRIGIDETGDFDPRSTRFHFIVAVLPRAGASERYERWEDGIPKTERHQNEVKGRLLSDDRLASFVNDVLLRPPVVRIRPSGVKPSQNGALPDHQQGMVAMMEKAALRMETIGDKALADKSRNAAKWLANKSSAEYLWLMIACGTIVGALYDLIVDARAGGYDSELRDIRILVDQKLFKARSVIGMETCVTMAYSRVMTDDLSKLRGLRATLHRMAITNHPFATQHFKTVEDDQKRWYFRPLLESACDLAARSTAHPEVRMADLVATVYDRANRRNASPRILEAHRKCAALVGSTSPPVFNTLDPHAAPVKRSR